MGETRVVSTELYSYTHNLPVLAVAELCGL